MDRKERKRTTLLEKLSSVPADKMSVLTVMLMYLNTALLIKTSTLYFTIDSHNLTLFVFVATGIIVEISWLLKS